MFRKLLIITVVATAALYLVTTFNASQDAARPAAQKDNPMSAQIEPPRAAQKPHTFTQHGITVEDPWAWLRDPDYPTVDNPEILAYLESENAYFEAHMAPLNGLVQELFTELKDRQPSEDESVPYEKNGYRYQWRYEKDAQYRTWYRAPVAAPEAWAVLLDERELAEGQEYFALGALAVSPDGQRLAYSTDTNGSERFTLHVIDIDSREVLTAPIEATLGSPAWNAASDALAYAVVNEQWQPLHIYLRSLGEPAAQDPLLYEEEDAAYRAGVSVSQSEKYVFFTTSTHTSSEVYFVPRDNLRATPTLIAARQPDFEYEVDHRDGEFVIRANLRQQNFDLYRAPEKTPGTEHWEILLAGDENTYLTDHLTLKDYVVVELRENGLDQMRVIAADGATHDISFDEAAYSVGFGTNASYDTGVARLTYTSMVTPRTVYDYDFESRTLSTLKVQEIPSGYDASQFVTTRLMAPARDGARVPVSIVHHRTTPIDGSAPLYLYGYGAYGLSMSPSFSTSRISLLERGFVYAIAHIRGGDEMGYDWYTQGKLENRTNTFNDFVDVAKHLIDENYARAGNIAIAGGSAGGKLMGAVVNQAPELWGAVAAHVPFVDVLNTILDGTLPLTPPEWSEWGNPIEDPDAFKLIQSYSPYDQLKPGEFPPMLVTAGLNDPRVTYWEPAKYVAKLRTLKRDDNVLLLKTNMGAGHGGKTGRFDALEELAEEYAFFLTELEAAAPSA